MGESWKFSVCLRKNLWQNFDWIHNLHVVDARKRIVLRPQWMCLCLCIVRSSLRNLHDFLVHSAACSFLPSLWEIRTNRTLSLSHTRTHMANQSRSTFSQALLTCSYQQQLQSKYVGILVLFDRHNGFLIWSQNLNNLLAYLTFCSSSGMVFYGCKIARQSITARATKWIISSVKLCSLQHTHSWRCSIAIVDNTQQSLHSINLSSALCLHWPKCKQNELKQVISFDFSFNSDYIGTIDIPWNL